MTDLDETGAQVQAARQALNNAHLAALTFQAKWWGIHWPTWFLTWRDHRLALRLARQLCDAEVSLENEQIETLLSILIRFGGGQKDEKRRYALHQKIFVRTNCGQGWRQTFCLHCLRTRRPQYGDEDEIRQMVAFLAKGDPARMEEQQCHRRARLARLLAECLGPSHDKYRSLLERGLAFAQQAPDSPEQRFLELMLQMQGWAQTPSKG